MPVTVRGTDILFNDGTTQGTAATAGGLVTTANVLNATAGASLGAVGTYAFLGRNSTGILTPGSTYAGSGLRYAGFIKLDPYLDWTGSSTTDGSGTTSPVPAGTWRAVGGTNTTVRAGATMFLRIS